jgi:hypothetical protein
MANWNEARQDCVSRGGDLAVPNSWKTNLKMYWLLRYERAWIGVYRDQNKMFITTAGVGVSYTNWDTEEPNNADGKEDCVAFFAVRVRRNAGFWNDKPCSDYNRFVCELVV